MGQELRITQSPSRERIERLSQLYPSNPFYTFNYVQARKLNGHFPVSFEYLQNREPINGFIAFVKKGFINKRIEIPSFPPISARESFWEDFIDLLSRKRFSYIDLGSFGSPERIGIPDLREIIGKKERREYHLNLSSDQGQLKMSSSHKRNIKKGQSSGIRVVSSTDIQACEKHLSLIDASMNRRMFRGEKVNNTRMNGLTAFLETKAAKLFQSVLNGNVLSSIMILEAPKGVYYHSAGTSAEGMALGASHYLVSEIAKEYRSQSKWLFNLGGTLRDQTGLERFKRGFGATPINLESFELYLGGYWKKILTTTAYVLKGNGSSAIRRI